MLQDENKMYTEKEAIELANKMIYEKAKQTYQIAINKMAQDFGIDKVVSSCHIKSFIFFATFIQKYIIIHTIIMRKKDVFCY